MSVPVFQIAWYLKQWHQREEGGGGGEASILVPSKKKNTNFGERSTPNMNPVH
jgi:hypothetical protein